VRTLILRVPPPLRPASGNPFGAAGAGVGSPLASAPGEANAMSIRLAVLKMPVARDGEGGPADADLDGCERGTSLSKTSVHVVPSIAPTILGAGAGAAPAPPPALQNRLCTRMAEHRVNVDAL
jgi:hypothetical protein